ncbi:hypothetical protein JHK84_047893 [Glycine max]|nr:hypothetical protein JHK84_047893 [Glycine max]
MANKQSYALGRKLISERDDAIFDQICLIMSVIIKKGENFGQETYQMVSPNRAHKKYMEGITCCRFTFYNEKVIVVMNTIFFGCLVLQGLSFYASESMLWDRKGVFNVISRRGMDLLRDKNTHHPIVVFSSLRIRNLLDFNALNPTCASITYGILLSMDCSAVHRSLSMHISFVRQVFADFVSMVNQLS